MKLGVLFSGGKDSCYAAWREKQKGHELACLISIISKNPDSYMFHTPNINLVKSQAKLMNLALITQNTKGVKEEELKDLEKAIKLAIKKYKIQGIVSGAIKSNYQKERVDNICKELNISSIAPLWQINEEIYLKEFMKNCNVIIVGIAADG